MLAQFQNFNKTFCTSAGSFDSNEATGISVYKNELLILTESDSEAVRTRFCFMGCIINPSKGILEINGQNITEFSFQNHVNVQMQSVGYVSNKYKLFAGKNIEENILSSLNTDDCNQNELRQHTTLVLKSLDLYRLRKKIPSQLSLFEIQKVMLARAIIQDHQIIVCDIPIPFLQKQDAETIMQILKNWSQKGKSIILLCNDCRYHKFADRVVAIKNGLASEIL